ncbi:nuclease-related domain-containing protein [Bacillus niameyensis]|uniref:nuclease-related domain-containing protein n=1 Tax=Bacillus niameyensis TaxID=1522308 RepID=UPI0007835BA5|nr:nuclease-related domain-containing protein [Bacillus niameyensis]
MNERSPALSLIGVKASASRLKSHHYAQPILASKSLSLEAGISGEQKVESVLNRHAFPMNYRVLHDLTLKTSQTFQMDHIFSTLSYSLVLETKNISGKLRFQENPDQLVRIRENGQIDAFECPAAQVRRNCELLQEWYASKNIYLPVYGVVVLAYPKQIVELAPKKTKVLFPSQISSFIRKLPQKPILSEESLHQLALELRDSNEPYIPRPICLAYDIPKSDIMTGVRCSSCDFLGMEKVLRGWHCLKCEHRDRFAHIQTMMEWFLIMGDTMTNKDCREFLHVDMKTATRILQSIDLIGSGGKRNRTYQINFSKLLKDGFFIANGFNSSRTGLGAQAFQRPAALLFPLIIRPAIISTNRRMKEPALRMMS